VRTLRVVVWLLIASAAVQPLPAADEAAKIYQQGLKAERAGQVVRAYLLYSQAAALDPGNQIYLLKSQAVQSRAALQSPPKVPRRTELAETGTETDAGPALDPLNPADRMAERNPKPPPELQAASSRQDFDLRADARSLWEQVAHAFGLDPVFDGDYQAGPPLRFHLTDADYREALHAAEAATGSFLVPISARLFLVAKDTEQKRRELEPTVSVTVPVPQATTAQELTEIGQAVRQVFTLEHLALDSQQNLVVMRDRISRVMPARRLLEQLLHQRPQVAIELELVELDRSSSLAYGLELPMTFPIAYLGTFWNSPLNIPSTITSLATFGGGQSLFGIGVASATLLANLSRSWGQTLVRTEIRAIDGLPASMHVGDRLPVLTSGYFGPASFSQGGQVYMPPPSFTFEDLGVSLKVTPHTHSADEITLDLETEFKVLSGDSINGIPVISSRKLVSKVRLGQGEWAVVAGLMTSSEVRTISGIAGLSSVPVLGQLFNQTNKDVSTTEVLMIIKPTLLSLPPDQFAAPAIWTGPDARPITPL